MLYREIIAICPPIHTKHINTLCGQNVELLNAEPGCVSGVASFWRPGWITTLAAPNKNYELTWNISYCISWYLAQNLKYEHRERIWLKYFASREGEGGTICPLSPRWLASEWCIK